MIMVEARKATLYVEFNLSNLCPIERVLARRPDLALIPVMQTPMGLDLARQHHPGPIPLDLHLPDLDGHEILSRLHQDLHLRESPVEVVSADATPWQVERIRRAGAREYLKKPIEVVGLPKAVDAALPQREEGA